MSAPITAPTVFDTRSRGSETRGVHICRTSIAVETAAPATAAPHHPPRGTARRSRKPRGMKSRTLAANSRAVPDTQVAGSSQVVSESTS